MSQKCCIKALDGHKMLFKMIVWSQNVDQNHWMVTKCCLKALDGHKKLSYSTAWSQNVV